jgi:hypothetical protein
VVIKFIDLFIYLFIYLFFSKVFINKAGNTHLGRGTYSNDKISFSDILELKKFRSDICHVFIITIGFAAERDASPNCPN